MSGAPRPPQRRQKPGHIFRRPKTFAARSLVFTRSLVVDEHTLRVICTKGRILTVATARKQKTLLGKSQARADPLTALGCMYRDQTFLFRTRGTVRQYLRVLLQERAREEATVSDRARNPSYSTQPQSAEWTFHSLPLLTLIRPPERSLDPGRWSSIEPQALGA